MSRKLSTKLKAENNVKYVVFTHYAHKIKEKPTN